MRKKEKERGSRKRVTRVERQLWCSAILPAKRLHHWPHAGEAMSPSQSSLMEPTANCAAHTWQSIGLQSQEAAAAHATPRPLATKRAAAQLAAGGFQCSVFSCAAAACAPASCPWPLRPTRPPLLTISCASTRVPTMRNRTSLPATIFCSPSCRGGRAWGPMWRWLDTPLRARPPSAARLPTHRRAPLLAGCPPGSGSTARALC